MTELDLPDAELDVMSCLWQAEVLTAREIREQLQPTRPMTHASVCTLLRRLEDKGLVRVLDLSGKVSVMVRFQGRVGVFNASIPLGAPVEQTPTSRNFIDDHVFAIVPRDQSILEHQLQALLNRGDRQNAQ